MDRRTFGTSMLLGAVGLAAAGPAAAQGRRMGQMMGAAAMGAPERRQVMETLMIGGVALQSSQVAQQRVERAELRRFAGLEIEENQDVARLLRELTGMGPQPPSAADRAALERLQRARGGAFESEYITLQLDGHERLLRVQQDYLAQGRNPTHRAVATLASGRIREHISDLRALRDMRS